MIFDLHNDLLTVPYARGKKNPPVFKQNIVYAVWTTELKDPSGFIKNLLITKRESNRPQLVAVEDLGYLSDIVFCESGLTDSIESNFKYSLEGSFANGIKSGMTDSKSTALLSQLVQLKPVYASLTWNAENAFAGGADTDAGLSQNGEKMIAFLESEGILLDTAHLSRRAFFQAAEVAKEPFVCSHTCFNGVFDHRRNLSDEQVKTIIAKGGLIGLCLVPKFMGKEHAGADDVVRQIDYFVQKFGDNNLGLGTDFNGCDNPALPDYNGFELVAEKLIKLGFAQNTIDKIFYYNVCDFLTQRKREK